jgi:two-component system sensor histidine kinase YesM
MVLTSLFLGLVLAYYITIRNYKHIDNIIKIIDSGKDEKCSFEEINVPVKNHYEYIEKRIIASFVEENKLKFQLAEDKYALKAIELKALRAQINPHFLLNTLETINWNIISICKKPTPANMAINCLAGILKYSLDNSKDGTILEEIEHTKNYIEIQMFRYHEKFDVEWKYNEQLTQYKIIKFVFQPLIENCIYHGINEKEGKGYIRIELLKDYSNIRIIISDNGKGIREEKLEEIRRTLKDPPKNFSEHIGLLNTNKRLKLEYGEEYGISITSMFNFGTHIYIDIPAIKK